jgi:hypothetical protein
VHLIQDIKKKGEEIALRYFENRKMKAIPWSRVFEQLIVTQLVGKFPTFHETRRFIMVFTGAHH